MSARLPVGIDGCPGGWVWVARCGAVWTGGVEAQLMDLPSELGLLTDGGPDWVAAQCGRNAVPVNRGLGPALIDMPCGLLTGGQAERACDRAARARLGRPRGSSVFRAPVRAVLGAPDYTSACALSRAHAGLALAKQTWHLVAKIRELDALLRAVPRPRLAEAHPELCLWGLAGGRAMAHAKRTPAGRAERLGLLDALAPALPELVDRLLAEQPRRRLAADDAIDAAALALSADLLGQRLCGSAPTGAGLARALPARAAHDDAGLPMRIWYCEHPAAGAEIPGTAARLQHSEHFPKVLTAFDCVDVPKR